MDPDRHELVKRIFAEAIALSPEERDAFVRSRCGLDEGLQREVADLLAAAESSERGPLQDWLGSGDTPAGGAPGSAAAPDRVGPYTIVRKIGEGGMGEVFLATQEEPIQRAVALKLIRPGLASPAVVARFESERQALAMMDHRNIARALDAGTTADGRPYFVMEYVEGVSITEYCDAERLSTPERLALFKQVCDGLQHAHQKAVIHRDIKSSNVLVKVEDGEAIPKVIDFGVAKALSRQLTDRTQLTEIGQILGTPESMSPEQASLGAQDIDTRTDIYSLGVLLYEVLVGVRPFDTKTLFDAGFEEVLRVIREVDPPRPSVRARTLGADAQHCSERRGTTVHRLSSQLHGDLDWITMKALEKDRARRYGSASELADDLERFLSHEPVSAGPPGARYRVGKFVRRHRFGVGVTAAGALLVGGFSISTYNQSIALAAERDRASEEAQGARELTRFVLGLFDEADPGRSKGADVTAREILDAGARKVDALQDRPFTKAAFGEAIGGIYGALGLFDEGRALLEDAHEFRALRGDGSRQDELALAANLEALGEIQVRGGDPDTGLSLLERSVEIRERLLGEHEDTAASLNGLGNALWNTGQLDEAMVVHRRALEMRRAVLGDEHGDVGSSLHNVASLAFIDGDLETAERQYEEALRIAVAAHGADDYGVATTMHTLAMVHLQQERTAEALPLEEQSLAIREKVLGPDHPHVALSLRTLAEILTALDDAERAEPLARRAVEIGLASWGPDYMDVWWMQRGHAEVLNALGRHEEALAIMDPLVTLVREAPRQTELDLHLEELAATLEGIAAGQRESGDTDAAAANEARAAACRSEALTLRR